jgi:hypothetical protein
MRAADKYVSKSRAINAIGMIKRHGGSALIHGRHTDPPSRRPARGEWHWRILHHGDEDHRAVELRDGDGGSWLVAGPESYPFVKCVEALRPGLKDALVTDATPQVQRKVFISYVRADAKAVDALADAIRAAGHPVWLDRDDLDGGVRWKSAIRQAIREGLAMVACFSPAYAERERTYMNEELVIAIEEIRQRPTDRTWFIPVRLGDCAIPERDIGGGETLVDLQYVDVFGDVGRGYAKVVHAIENVAQNSR